MKKINKTAFSALLCALSVVILYCGSLFSKIDIASAVLASVCVSAVLAEFGYRRAFGAYAAASVLGLILVPSKTAPVLFAVFFGYYPILKIYAHSRFSSVGAWILKYAVLNAVFAVSAVFVTIFVMKIKLWVLILFFVLLNLIFPVLDFAYAAALRIYSEKIRSRFL